MIKIMDITMRGSKAKKALPLSVSRALKKLGADISVARRRRNISTLLMSERAFITRNTLAKVEKGDAGVSLGIYASVLFVLGMIDQLSALADPSRDSLGQDLAEERLPKRIRTRRAILKEGGPHAA
jgi:transcriptional regulator with XRE-family HTH domain